MGTTGRQLRLRGTEEVVVEDDVEVVDQSVPEVNDQVEDTLPIV